VTAQPDHSWRRILKRRLVVAAVLGVAWTAAIEARLVYLQVVQYDFLITEAKKQQLDTVTLDARRGDIYDRNGRLLAYNVDADSIWADATQLSDPRGTVAALCAVLRDCKRPEQEQYISRISKRTEDGRLKQFVWLRRRISPDEALAVTKLQLDGIYLKKETRRYYPQREVAAHLLGYVGDGNIGLAGLEQKYQTDVGGEPGKVLMQIDRKQRPFSRVEQPPTPGASLLLTIDSNLQRVAERELAAGVEWSGAEGGTAIVMDPMTGEILALANAPTFNPNAFNDFSEEVRINRATQYVYEPGSTFKVVTAGAALEEHVARPTDLIHTSPGVMRFGSRVIDEAKGHNYGTLTFEEVIVKSSNVGAIKIGLQVGAERLSAYVARFGFGARTSQDDFGGESRGIVWKASDLTPSAVASVSMGYQVSVTPMQMAAAVSAVANGGQLLEPRVVKAVIRNGVQTSFPSKVVRRVLSADVAAQLTAIMEGVVERGTAKSAQIEGFTIAGKTGTAAKTLKTGGYSTADYNVSFVGFVPSRNPVFTILVLIDSPHKVSAYGGTVAAPVFQKIAAAALRLRGVPPSLNPPAPLVIARRDAVHQQPVSGPTDAVVTFAGATSESPAVLPDLVGMNVRDAALALVRLGLTPQVNGSGYVVASQRPAPGSALDDIDAATLWLERRPRLEPPLGEVQPAALAGQVAPRGRP
jgi:cell division protein FtsI (penicillin-binding protein 3)